MKLSTQSATLVNSAHHVTNLMWAIVALLAVVFVIALIRDIKNK